MINCKVLYITTKNFISFTSDTWLLSDSLNGSYTFDSDVEDPIFQTVPYPLMEGSYILLCEKYRLRKLNASSCGMPTWESDS